MSLDPRVVAIHTLAAKVAISVPDAECSAVDDMATRMGISRSQFFATAARRYLEELERVSLTASVDEAIAVIGRGGHGPEERAWSRRAAKRTRDRNPW